MLDNPKIRAVTLNDAAEIVGLAGQLGYPSSVEQAKNRLSAILEEEGQIVLVASLPDDSVVGWIHVFQTHRVESDSFAELGGLVVDERHRKRGIGKMLVVAAEEWTSERGISKLRVRTRSSRVEAHSFYDSLGFQLTKEQRVYDQYLLDR